MSVLDVRDGQRVSDLDTGSGVDCDRLRPQHAPRVRPQRRAGRLFVAALSEDGHLALLGSAGTARGAHCVTIDGRGNAYVGDPAHGRLLVFRARSDGPGGAPVIRPEIAGERGGRRRPTRDDVPSMAPADELDDDDPTQHDAKRVTDVDADDEDDLDDEDDDDLPDDDALAAMEGRVLWKRFVELAGGAPTRAHVSEFFVSVAAERRPEASEAQVRESVEASLPDRVARRRQRRDARGVRGALATLGVHRSARAVSGVISSSGSRAGDR